MEKFKKYEMEIVQIKNFRVSTIHFKNPEDYNQTQYNYNLYYHTFESYFHFLQTLDKILIDRNATILNLKHDFNFIRVVCNAILKGDLKISIKKIDVFNHLTKKIHICKNNQECSNYLNKMMKLAIKYKNRF